MTKDSLKRKIKEEGLAGSVLYYLGRFCSKAELALVGKWFGNHGKLRQNCIVLKNRTMQDPCLLLWRCCRIFFLYKQYSLPKFLPL